MKNDKEIKKALMIELEELESRYSRLHSFITGNTLFQTLSDEEKDLMIKQAQAMGSYAKLLKKRIALH